MTTQYPLNHSAFTDPFSVFYTLYHYLFVSQSLVVLPILVNQNSAFYNNPQLSHAAQSFGYFKPLKPSPLFNRSPALLPRLATLKFGLQLFAAPIQNIGNHLINHLISSFDFKAAKATNGQRVLMIETLKTENQWSLTLLILDSGCLGGY